MAYVGCQLATEYTTWPKGALELAVEPKLDGYRLTAIVTDDSVSFHCRSPKPVDWSDNLSHIAEALLALGFRNCMVDGEVMAENWNSTGAVRRKARSSVERAQIQASLKFHAFDLCLLESIESARVGRGTKMIDPTPLCQRRARLAAMIGEHPVVKLVESFVVSSEQEMAQVLLACLQAGHEGVMVKDVDAPYVCDRTKHWQKLKPTKTVEAQITGMVEGTGKYVGMLGAISCVLADGTEVSVGTGLVDAQRAEFWAKRDVMVGQILEVKLQDLSSGSATATARHPVFVRMRPDRSSLAQ